MKCQFKGCSSPGKAFKDCKSYCVSHFTFLKKRNPRNIRSSMTCEICNGLCMGINRQRYCGGECKKEGQRRTNKKNQMEKMKLIQSNKGGIKR